MQKTEINPRIYVRLVADVLTREQCPSIAELVEAAKRECVRRRLPYEAGQVQHAIDNMRGQIDREIALTDTIASWRIRDGDTYRPISREVAADVVHRLGVSIKVMR